MKTKIFATFLMLLSYALVNNISAENYYQFHEVPVDQYGGESASLWVMAGTLSYSLFVRYCPEATWSSAEAGFWTAEGDAYIYCHTLSEWRERSLSGSIVLTTDQVLSVGTDIVCGGEVMVSLSW